MQKLMTKGKVSSSALRSALLSAMVQACFQWHNLEQ